VEWVDSIAEINHYWSDKGYFSQKYIADLLKVSQSCLSQLLKQMNCHSNLENLSRSGSPRKTDNRSDKWLMFWGCISYFLLRHWYFSTYICEYWFSEACWHFKREFMPVVSKHLVVSHSSSRMLMLPCTILCALFSGKMDKVFQLSLATIVAGCQHYRKHFGKLSRVACKKIFRTVKLVAIWLRAYWNADMNCIRPVFGTSLFHNKFAV